MKSGVGVSDLLEQINEACPAGFAVALHIKFMAPRYLFQAYRRDWIEHYSAAGMVMQDPTVHWGFENLGSIRWSALAERDPAGVMEQAAQYGLAFGFTVAIDAAQSRTVASFARSDREFSDGEIVVVTDLLMRLHLGTRYSEALSPLDHAALKRLSILLTHTA